MKKKILAVLLTAVLLGTMTSCSNRGDETTTTPAPANGTTQPTEGTTDPADEPDPEPTTNPDEEGDPDASEQTDCQKLTDAVLKSPSLEGVGTMQVNDETMLADILNYDVSLFDEYSVVMHLMSAHLIEISVVKPAEGKTQEVLDFFEKRKEQLINEVAFYPAQQENAEQTVYGEKDGYAYLLCGFDSAEMEESFLKAIENQAQ